jgi:hypothetical protein
MDIGLLCTGVFELREAHTALCGEWESTGEI